MCAKKVVLQKSIVTNSKSRIGIGTFLNDALFCLTSYELILECFSNKSKKSMDLYYERMNYVQSLQLKINFFYVFTT